MLGSCGCGRRRSCRRIADPAVQSTSNSVVACDFAASTTAAADAATLSL